MFKALLLEQQGGIISATITDLDESRLPEGEVEMISSRFARVFKDSRLRDLLANI